MLARRRRVFGRPLGPGIAGSGLNRNRALQRKSWDTTRWRRRCCRLVVGGCDAAHFVPAHVCSDVFEERGKVAIGPVFVKYVEPQRVALDDEVVESRHRVWVIARAAHHSAKFLAHLLNNEELFWSSDAESQPYANDISLRQFGLPWAWLNVGQAVCS